MLLVSIVDDAFSWRSLVWVGRHSYGLYLRHWPLLITYMLRSANDSVPVSAGLAIMVASLLLTLATEWLVRKAMPVGGCFYGFRQAARATVGGVGSW